jgi:hypothetical protein
MIKGSVYFPVLDGPNPQEWQPWGTRFGELTVKVDELPLRVDPAFKDFPRYEPSLLLQATDRLFDRHDDEWSRFVGLVVDGRPMDREGRLNIEEAFGRVLTKVRSAQEALYPKLGFYLLVVAPSDSTASHAPVDGFITQLQLIAEAVLGQEVLVEEVPSQSVFLVMLKFYKQMIFNRSIKSSRS